MNTDDAAEPAPFRYHAVRNGDWGVRDTVTGDWSVYQWDGPGWVILYERRLGSLPVDLDEIVACLPEVPGDVKGPLAAALGAYQVWGDE